MFVIKVDKRKSRGKVALSKDESYVIQDEATYTTLEKADVFETAKEATAAITEPWEYVVEITTKRVEVA